MVKVGDPVIYVDPTATPRPSVVTAVFGGPLTDEERARMKSGYYGGEGMTEEQVAVAEAQRMPPSLNLVFVSPDGARGDMYGRQVERATSIPHRTKQAAHGNYWREITPADLPGG